MNNERFVNRKTVALQILNRNLISQKFFGFRKRYESVSHVTIILQIIEKWVKETPGRLYPCKIERRTNDTYTKFAAENK